MEIKTVTTIEFEDAEISALQTIARIDCIHIDCDDCPLQDENDECIKGSIKRALIREKITW